MIAVKQFVLEKKIFSFEILREEYKSFKQFPRKY